MKLTKQTVSDYLDYIFAAQSKSWREQKSEQWLGQLESGQRLYSQYWFEYAKESKDSARPRIEFAISLERSHPTELWLLIPSANLKSKTEIPAATILATFKEAQQTFLEDLDYQQYQSLELRVTHCEAIPRTKLDLNNLGFTQVDTRVEYKADVSDLPGDQGTPIVWRSAASLDTPELKMAAQFLSDLEDGSSEWRDPEANLNLLLSYFREPEFPFSAETLSLGFVDNELAALVIAQVNAEGWSRLTYMALKQEFRGRGLGAWVQRRGFAMFKKLGGKDYHGGTAASNAAMIRLFEKHGCARFRTMDEWRFQRPD